MVESWEFTARKARQTTNDAPARKLRETRKEICRNIETKAILGESTFVIDFLYYDVSCPEDWSYIFNWLIELGYEVQDYSGRKISQCFVVHW